LSTSSGLNLTLMPAVVKPYLVNAMYDLLLQRPVDPTGLAAWSAALGNGQSTTDVAQQIARSPEARAQQVQNLYGQFLHRAADPTGLAAFSAALTGGQTLEQVAAAMVGSPEYVQTRGGGTAPGFLNALYQDALNRPVDATGLAGFSQALAQGASHQQVADQVFASDEFQQNLVDNYYQYFLRRPAESAGLKAWTDDLRHGVTIDQVMAGIAGSPEMLGSDPIAVLGASHSSSSSLASAPRGPGGGPGGGGEPGSAGKLGNPMPFQAFDPTPVADTTNPADPNFGPFVAGVPKTWNVVPGPSLPGNPPIPAGAQELVLTVTVLNPAPGGGTLTINQSGVPPLPQATISVDPGVTGPASYVIVVAVGPGGTVTVTSSFATNLAIDVDGFYLSTLDPGDQFPITGNIDGQGTISGQNNSTAGNSSGIVGQISSTSPGGFSAGVRGINNGTGGLGIGVFGSQNGGGYGVYGTVTGAGLGVYGHAPNGTGVFGDGTTGVFGSGTTGVSGSGATNGLGVDGSVTGAGDTSAGVRGSNFSTAAGANGVIGQITSTSPGSASAGLRGINNGTGGLGIGVYGSQNGTGWGVYGTAAGAGIGVNGAAGLNGIGVNGSVTGSGNNSAGVVGSNFSTAGSANGVIGQITDTNPGGLSAGVRGINNGTGGFGIGVYGSQNGSGWGVYGTVTGAGLGVFGSAPNGTGVFGSGTTGVSGSGTTGVSGSGASNGLGVDGSVTGSGNSSAGVRGSNFSTAANAFGIVGQITSTSPGSFSAGLRGINNGTGGLGIGVYGSQAGSGYGVYGTTSGAGIGVVGQASGVAGSLAGVFLGNVNVTGTLTSGVKDFKIDDPLDPANKYLYHTSVESPDMMNIYNGNVTTDANGNATVTLPNYFMALNQDYRYQLTPIGQFAQVMVSSGVQDNQFSIRTDKPNVQVSWQVTGIRHDPFANANRSPTEVAKTGNEVGHYLYPELYGQPASLSIASLHQQP
jgi:hypothetical protein